MVQGLNRRKDAETGLGWREAEVLERTRKLRIENNQAERAQDKDWMRTEDVRAIITLIVDALEHIPGKAKSELGLTPEQEKVIRRMIDEARHNSAEKIAKLEPTRPANIPATAAVH